jgi:hypothetical protein
MHDRGYFNGLFTDSAEKARVNPSEHVITHWLCSYVRTRFPEFLLELISRHQQRLSLRFSRALAQTLWSDRNKKVDPRFATWLSIVLLQGQNVVDGDTWGYLLKKCRLPDHLGIALRIFEFLTTPNVQLMQNWWGYSTDDSEDQPAKRNFKVDFEIEWPEKSGYCLREAWTEVFQPHLSDIADPLSQIVVKQLTQAYLLLRSVVKDHNLYDRISRSRSSIAPHEQDDTSLNECVDCLIDILRCILDHWIETNSAQARVQADAWWSSKLLLLQRFAAYAYSRDPQYTADERIRWVLANDLVFLSGMKKEVFDILASAYGQASPGIRQRLLRRIDRGIRGREAKWLDEEILAYEKFNVLIWLRRADPGCPLVQSAISAIQGQFPEFGEREYPEFDSWHSTAEFIDPTQDFDLNLILSKPPAEFASELIQARRDPQLRVLQNHIRCLPRLFPNNKTWTEGFIQALSKYAAVDDDVWNGVIGGLRDAVQTEEDWRWVIGLIEMLPRNTAIHEAIANLLSWGLREHRAKMGEDLIERAVDLMDVAWNLCKDKEEPADSGYGDWLTTAMGHAGGWFGDFWIHYSSHLRVCAGEQWQGIPDPLKTKIIDAVGGTSRIKVHARIALTPWIGYFFAWDRDFTSSFLLPLLDWKRDPIVAQQSWSVLLNYKRGTTKDFEAQLLPFYRQCAEQITSMMKEATEKSGQFNQNSLWRLGSQLAMLAIHVVSNPVESGFFRDFLPLLPDRARESLASTIGEQLESQNEDEIRQLWNAWLKRYLELRLVGIPLALSTSETKHMLAWCLHVGPVFSEAVELIVQMPQKGVFAYGILSDLAESPLVDEFPQVACRLAVAAMRAEEYPALHDSLNKLHQRFKLKIHKEAIFSEYEELLYLRDWKKA